MKIPVFHTKLKVGKSAKSLVYETQNIFFYLEKRSLFFEQCSKNGRSFKTHLAPKDEE
jgi:hypothetical protein